MVIHCSSFCFGAAPTWRAAISPFLKIIKVGIDMMPYFDATPGFSSTLSFTILTLSPRVPAHIRRSFERVRELHIHGLFEYGFFTLAVLAASGVMMISGPISSALLPRMARLQAEGKLPLEAGSGWFKWQGRTYGRPDDGLLVAYPNPWNPKRMLILVLSNSRTQQWAMTKTIPRGLPGWTLYRGSDVQQKGQALAEGMVVDFKP